MKRLISIVCVLVIVLQVGCAKQDKKVEKINDVNDIIVEPGDFGPSFLLKNGNLYGWNVTGIYDDSYLVDEDKLLMMQDVESFLYQEGLADDVHANMYGARMLYVKKNDGSFWMRGYDDELEYDDKKIMHNYKELTKVMDDVKAYYKDAYQGVYVIKNDNSLWCWSKPGKMFNGKIEYDFFKVMDEVKCFTVGYGDSPDFAIKTDGSLWSIDSDVKELKCVDSNEWGMKEIEWCNFDGPLWGSHMQTMCAVDSNGDMWCWDYYDHSVDNVQITPQKIASGVKEYIKFGDSERGYWNVYLRNDNSIFVLNRDKHEAIEIASNVEKVIANDYDYDCDANVFYILDKNGLLYKYNIKKQKKTDISSNVKDFAFYVQQLSDDIMILKNDNTLVSGKGEVYLENVSGIYMSESVNYGRTIAIAENNVYDFNNEKAKCIFTLE